jgi:hypothetical protein
MNAFKRKSLYAAVIAGLGTAASMQAGAVNLGTDNTGEVLLYPYYTVRNGYITSFSIVNSSVSETKAVKVRFLEGKNSAEVLDFNLFLSRRDVWTGSITQTGAGAMLSTNDRSCTTPPIPAAGQPFSNAVYTGTSTAGAGTADNGGDTLDRTREGYIEVIEMGVVSNAAVITAVTHTSAGTPANCAVVQASGLLTNGVDIQQPTGGLSGNGIIINSTTGTEFGYVPTALANFSDTALYSESGSTLPDLSNVSPPTSMVFQSTLAAPAVVTDTWANPNDAVSAVFMHSQVHNEYDVETNFKTDWIITMPTKRAYVNNPLVAALPPFANLFTGLTPGSAMSCDPVFVAAYDREEAPYSVTTGAVFSPAPLGAVVGFGNLCWETTVVTIVPNTGSIATSSVYGSANAGSITLPANGTGSPVAPNYVYGWISLTPTGALTVGQTVAGNPTGDPVITAVASGGLSGALGPTSGLRYRGLPMIGFAAISAQLAGQGYGGIFNHKYTTTITLP